LLPALDHRVVPRFVARVGEEIKDRSNAKAARGELSPQQSVAEAEKQLNGIFQNWRSRGLVAG
jgi:hypothetical protein